MSGRPQKMSTSELKLRRLAEHNQRLKEDLARPRIRVSEASVRCAVSPQVCLIKFLTLQFRIISLIRYCKSTKDYLVPSVWGTVSKAEDPFGAPPASGCQCIIM
ncbi:hypothetical protein AcW1_006094 [Taiwanofungus camphoratus]|nr:hypothetical protein AcW2_004856 [Antrodia cinnamomea]KAI0934638.1 hypothetical protein AcV5_006414 [Antrodia cinnamomea]KAI0957829.1 hypothetical protein AcW1_006094 [Antrodia cinnamomea]